MAAGYLGILETIENKKNLTSVISNGSLASGTTSWTMNSNYTTTQYDGYVGIVVKTAASSGFWANYQSFTSITGQTSATNQVLYAQGMYCGKPSVTKDIAIMLRRAKNGGTASYTALSSIDSLPTPTCTVGYINLDTLPSGGYAYVTLNNDTSTHYTSGTIPFTMSDTLTIHMDRTTGYSGVYLYRDKANASDMPDYHENGPSLTYTWNPTASTVPYDFSAVSIVFDDDGADHLNCTIKLEMAWRRRSGLFSTYDGTDYYSYDRICFAISSSTTVGDGGYFKNIILLNLTTLFGRGNEPDKEWCDAHISMEDGNVVYKVNNEKAVANILTNGLLTDSTTGWTKNTSYYSYTSYGSYQGAYISTAYSSTSHVYAFRQDFSSSITGSTASTYQKIYMRATIRAGSNNIRPANFCLRAKKNGSSSVSVLNNTVTSSTFTDVSAIYQTYDGTDYYELLSACVDITPATSANDEVYVKNVFVINLTSEFGRGNEPTKAWCDENLSLRGNYVVYPATPVNSYAQNISKIYIGINDVARRIKRAYIGINGIARRWFGLPDFYAFLNWGTTSDTLAASKYGMAAGSVGDTAIFAGGITNLLNTVTSTMTFNNAVDAYNSSLVHSTLPNMPYQIGNAGAAVLGNQMLIMGGINTASNGGLLGAQKTTTTVMDYGWYYNAGLISTGVFAGANLSVARGALKGDTIGNYALFAGGNLACDGTTTASFSNAVEAFSSATVKVTSPSNLASTASKLASCHSDNYVIFAGGIHSGVDPQGYVNSESSITGVSSVTAYSTSLVRTYPSNLTYVDCYPSATSVGNYLLVATRNTTTDATTGTINVYNGSTLSKLTSLTLPKNKNNMMSATVNGCGYFFGGWLTQQGYSSGAFSNTVDGYTSELVHFITSNLSTPRIESCVATTGDYTLLAGGKSSGSLMMSVLSNVETYKLAKTPVVGITSGGGTTTSQSYYSAYIKVGDTNYTSIGNITVNAGESLTICAKAATGSYTSGNTTYYYNANVVIRVNGTTVYTVQYNGSYTSSYYNYSLGTVSEDTAYSVSLVYGYQTHTGTSPNTYYVDVYTIPGMLKESEPTPTPTPTNLIAFTVQVYVNRSGTSTYWNYVAESGMTWTQFISSTYNAGDFYASSTYAGYYAPSSWGTTSVALKTASGGSNVALTATIIADHVYYCSVSE